MALARSQLHGKPAGRVHEYIRVVQPLGYPNSAVICGRPDCRNPGEVRLKNWEEDLYRKRERIFSLPNNEGTRIKVK